MRLLLPILALVALSGCATPLTPHRLKDTQTVHDAAANRLWLIHESPDGNASVVFCDAEMYRQTRSLCVKWPQ